MHILKTEEFQENGYTYEKVTYDNGTVDTHIKQSDIEPPQEPVTLEDLQEQIKELQAQSTTTGEQINEIYAAQAGDTVVKSELDAAYREGVNSYE